jgi:hypothetical protein
MGVAGAGAANAEGAVGGGSPVRGPADTPPVQGPAGAPPVQGPEAAPPTPGAVARVRPSTPTPTPEVSPEHAPASDESDSAPPPPGTPGNAPLDHLPTMVTGSPQASPPGTPPAVPAHPAYGSAQQHPQPAAYGYPQQPAGWGATPAYAPPPGSTPPYGPTPLYGPGAGAPQEPPRRSGRSTAALVAVALVVALGAGGSVYALMSGDGNNTRSGGDTTASATTGAPTTADPTTQDPTPQAPTTQPPTTAEVEPGSGAIPAEYLGTWTAVIDNATGHNTRRLTIQQGEVGDTVLSLTAEGPAGGGTYHCVFQAELAEEPTDGGSLAIGPSTVTVGEPATSCTPGAATELTILPDGRLRRVNTSNGDELTYTKQG